MPQTKEQYASPLRRLAAYLIDILVSMILKLPLLIWYGKGLFSDESGIYLLGYGSYLFGAMLMIRMGYLVIGWSTRFGTIGCRACGIRIGDIGGSRLSFARSFARYWALVLSSLTLGAGCLPLWFTKRRQTLYDLLAASVVVRTQRS